MIKKEPKEKINNTKLVADFRAMGGQIYHRRPNGFRRGVTFAFVAKGSRIQIATALQHRSDDFTKKVGTKTAIQHFNEGKTIFLPHQNDCKPIKTVRDLTIYL